MSLPSLRSVCSKTQNRTSNGIRLTQRNTVRGVVLLQIRMKLAPRKTRDLVIHSVAHQIKYGRQSIHGKSQQFNRSKSSAVCHRKRSLGRRFAGGWSKILARRLRSLFSILLLKSPYAVPSSVIQNP